MFQKNSVEVNEVDVTQDTTKLSDAARHRERKLRTKIDLCVVPTVTLLYLMCYIDRANIGACTQVVCFLEPVLMNAKETHASLGSRKTWVYMGTTIILYYQSSMYRTFFSKSQLRYAASSLVRPPKLACWSLLMSTRTRLVLACDNARLRRHVSRYSFRAQSCPSLCGAFLTRYLRSWCYAWLRVLP
jgi:hypothetical protein